MLILPVPLQTLPLEGVLPKCRCYVKKKKLNFLLVPEKSRKAGINIRDYSPPQDGFAAANLIQSPSRIKRGSRHVSVIVILEQ